MKVRAIVLPLVLVAIGFSTTQAGLFDSFNASVLDRLGLRRAEKAAVAECEPTSKSVSDSDPKKRLREVIKQPCEPTLHTYQRQTARPLPTGSRECAKPPTPKPIAECETSEEVAAVVAAVARRKVAVSIARLIFRSQTSCYAHDRRVAIHRLGDGHDCSQNPEILVAFIYALNDADESVRAKAADEIGDQIGQHPDCAVPEVVAALKVALGDCDKSVRREVRQALDACRIDVVRVRDGDCARPAEKCVPKTQAVPKKPAYEKPAEGGAKIEKAGVAAAESKQTFVEKSGLPRLVKYVKSLKRSKARPSLQKLFPSR